MRPSLRRGRNGLFRRVLLLCGAALLAASPVSADEGPNFVRTSAGDVDIRLTGTFQPRLSWGRSAETDTRESEDRLGFGLRRARFRATATFDDRVGVHYDVDVRGGSLSSVDLYAFYRSAEAWRVRVGYLAGAQPRSYIPTSHTRVDGIDRAAIAERWSEITIGSRGRDFGVDVRRLTDTTRLELFLHNGDGANDPGRGNFRQSISDNDATRGIDRAELAVSAAGAVMPAAVDGLEVGGFAGYNAARGPYTAVDGGPGRSYGSWSAHVYYGANPGSQPFRFKAEALGVHFESGETGDGVAVPARDAIGWAVFGAASLVEHSEVFARYEQFDADTGIDADEYWVFGASYSRSAARGLDYRQERITLAYTNALPGLEAAADQHLTVVQLQWVF